MHASIAAQNRDRGTSAIQSRIGDTARTADAVGRLTEGAKGEGLAQQMEEKAPCVPYQKLFRDTKAFVEQLFVQEFRQLDHEISNEHTTRQSLNKRFTLEAKAWTLESKHGLRQDLRMVLILGSKNAIINTWCFPYEPSLLPVFAAELIAIGAAPKLTFLDIQVPCLQGKMCQRVSEVTNEFVSHYQDLRISEQPPEWAIDESTGSYLFARQQSADYFPRISAAYMQMLTTYFRLILSEHGVDEPQPSSPSHTKATALRQLAAYQIHHMQNSPGKVFLGKLFGQEWTDSFLTDFLFRVPGETL